MNKYDVVVIGAGPSGLHTARRLAEKGLDVLILEKKSRVGEAVNCAGLIGTEVFDEFGLAKDSILRSVQDVKLVSPEGSSIEYNHPSCFACVVDRDLFDRGIGEKALAAGARIEAGTTVVDVRPGVDRVEILAKKNGNDSVSVSARVAVLATGIQQELSRKLGLGSPKHYLHGAQVEVEAGDEGVPTIFAGTDIAAGGFAWAVPSRPGMVKYGLVTEGDAKTCFHAFAEKHLGRESGRLEGQKIHFKPIAQGLTSRTFGRRVLAVGEAAGQVKTTTGGGVAFGLRCAEIAADVIARKLDRGELADSSLAEYEKLWKRELRTEILLGFYARRIWSRMSDTHIERVFQFARMDGVIPIIREKGEFDRHGELILALLRRFSLFGILDGISSKIPRLN